MKKSTKKNLKKIAAKLTDIEPPVTSIHSKTTHSLEFCGHYAKDSKYAMEVAESMGWEINFGSPTLLLIDVDKEENLIKVHQCLHVYQQSLEHGEFEDIRFTKSKSGIGYHIYVYLHEDDRINDDTQRIMTQAMLGSDPLREILGVKIRVDHNDKTPSLFFELPGTHLQSYSLLWRDVIQPMEEKWTKAREAREAKGVVNLRKAKGKPPKKHPRMKPLKTNDCGDGSSCGPESDDTDPPMSFGAMDLV